MIRLGVAVRILGQAGLRARDGRRAEHAPHLSVSLLLVREVLAYLAEQQIGCYRLADDLAPYLTDERHPAFARQIDECGDVLAEIGALAREHGIRLSMHLPMYVTLAAPDAAVAERGCSTLWGLGRRQYWCSTWAALTAMARQPAFASPRATSAYRNGRAGVW